jgi:hypothetical protein
VWKNISSRSSSYYDVMSGPSYEVGPLRPYYGCSSPYTSQKFRTKVKVQAYSYDSGYYYLQSTYKKNGPSKYLSC